ncbi:MAG: diacylglycerol kinase family protein [Actinomycetota bacterium]
MRALLIVNPRATSTTVLRRDVITRALASAVELTVEETRYRGHASRLAGAAVNDGHGLVLTLGGDGTANEAINGIVSAGRDSGRPAPQLPALAALPGGSANVLTRALGLPADPIDAAGRVLSGLAEGRERSIGLGLAQGRYFAFNAGLGLDAEVVRAVEGLRARGRTATPGLYMRAALRQYYRVTDRRHPALTLERDGEPVDGPLFVAIVSNTTPWTYVGGRPVQSSPQAGFDTGLDLFALRSMRTVGTFRVIARMLAAGDQPPRGGHVVSLHDEAALTIRASRPVAFQVDGEYMGEHESVLFEAIPDAIRVIT